MGVVLPQPIPFGKYTLFERIGRGGMADVFKARIQGPAGFERTFVVKRILPHLSDDESFTHMFIDEAKIAAKLTHPNIVQVFELGSVDGEYFMSMEYVRGHDLAETMRTLWARVGPPHPEMVAYIGREMCRALAYAHEFTSDEGQMLGMIHRDVSPSNVMLSFDGAVKLLDFGIAKALGGDADEGTKSGTLKGKFAYMAPEQTTSNEIDRRIDIFATGIVLHEMLTGRRLFKGENDMQTIERVRRCEVLPPSLHNPLCPPELDQMVLQALAKDRDQRYQSASEMADALDDVVYAARFQAGHLAAAMRSLFPVDVGADSQSRPRMQTSSVSPSRSNASSGSGISRRPRSPTIPAVVQGAPTGSHRVAPSQSQAQSPAQTDASPPRPPVLRAVPGWVFISGLLLLGFAFVAGAIWTLRGAHVLSPSQSPIPKIIFLDLAFQSTPIGAEVFVVGSNEYLGHTPFRRKVEYRDDRTSFVVFRLPGYQETTKEIRPDWSGEVSLQPQPQPQSQAQSQPQPQRPPAPPPTQAPPPSEPSPAPSAPEPVAASPRDTSEKSKPKKVRARPHKGTAPDAYSLKPKDSSLNEHKPSPFE